MKKLFAKIFIFISLPLLVFPQAPGKSKYEKKWALVHPFAALRVKKIYNKAIKAYTQKDLNLQLDSFSNGGKKDAFRHTYYMAAFTQQVQVSKLRKLGKAHEKGNYRQFLKGLKEDTELPDSIGTAMDLANNELGFKIGKENKTANYEELVKLVIKSIQNGEAKIIRRNKKEKYVDCSGKEINIEQFLGLWNIPKCLVSSNYVYID